MIRSLGLDELRPASKATEAPGVAVPNDLDLLNAALDRVRRIKDTAAFVLDPGTPNRYSPAIAKSYTPQTCDRIAG